jgi:hypothetical protein
VQLCLQVVWHESWHWLVAEKVLHRMVPQRLTVVARVDALLIVGEWGGERNRAGLNMSWC